MLVETTSNNIKSMSRGNMRDEPAAFVLCVQRHHTHMYILRLHYGWAYKYAHFLWERGDSVTQAEDRYTLADMRKL